MAKMSKRTMAEMAHMMEESLRAETSDYRFTVRPESHASETFHVAHDGEMVIVGRRSMVNGFLKGIKWVQIDGSA